MVQPSGIVGYQYNLQMLLTFVDRPADSPLIERVWRSHSVASGLFHSMAEGNLELVVTRLQDLTRSLKHLIGQTPLKLQRHDSQLSFLYKTEATAYRQRCGIKP